MTVELPPPWNFTWMIVTGPDRNRDEAATHFARPWPALPDPYTSASPSGESRSQAWRSWAAAKSFTRRVTARLSDALLLPQPAAATARASARESGMRRARAAVTEADDSRALHPYPSEPRRPAARSHREPPSLNGRRSKPV